MIRLLGVSGSPSRGSRTAAVIRLALDGAAARHEGVQAELLELPDCNLVFCDGRPPDAYDGDTRRVIDLICAADAYVFGSPMYRGSYTGALKNLFDLLPNEALAGKAAGMVATACSDHHFLALEHQLRPVLSFFRAHTVPGVVYAQNAHFTADGALEGRAMHRSLSAIARAITGTRWSGPRFFGLPAAAAAAGSDARAEPEP